MKRKNITTEMMKGYLADALLVLMERKGFASITISEIAAKAGVNRATYYRHFTGKDQLIEFWFSGIMDEYLRDYQSKDTHSARSYLDTIFICFSSHRKELLCIHEQGLSHLMLRVLNRIFEESLGVGQDGGRGAGSSGRGAGRDAGRGAGSADAADGYRAGRNAGQDWGQDGGQLSTTQRYQMRYHTGGIFNFLLLWLADGMDEPSDVMVKRAAACFPGHVVPMYLARQVRL